MLTILIASWWARRLRGNAAAVLVATLGLADMFLFSRGTILFLDVFAAPLLMLSAVFLSESRGRFWATFASGLAMGVAILFTQKAVVAGLAVAMVFLARWLRREDAGDGSGGDGIGVRGWLREVAGFATGGAAAALLLPATLGFGGLGAFWQDNVVMNMAWKARHFPSRDGCLGRHRRGDLPPGTRRPGSPIAWALAAAAPRPAGKTSRRCSWRRWPWGSFCCRWCGASILSRRSTSRPSWRDCSSSSGSLCRGS